MYNLIVTAESDAWDGRRYALHFTRFLEHTAESLKARYQGLDERAVAELTSFPTVFAYEEPLGQPARVGRVTRIRSSSRGEVRFDYELFDEVEPIPSERLAELEWDLDIGGLEMNRTHWAVKDVDLLGVIRDAGLVQGNEASILPWTQSEPDTGSRAQVVITPEVFVVPDVKPDPRLAALMMPFSADFDSVAEAVRLACRDAGLNCERADDIWEETTLIQGVFSLIYRSAVVIVDLSGRNSNVLYETGIAHTLGRPVVPISRDVTKLPVDLAHHRVLLYLANSEGLDEMKPKLARRLRHVTDRRDRRLHSGGL